MRTQIIEIGGQVVYAQQFTGETAPACFHIIEGTVPDNDKGENAKLVWQENGLKWVAANV